MAFNQLSYTIERLHPPVDTGMPFGRLLIDDQPLDQLVEAYEEAVPFDIVGGYGGLVFYRLEPGELITHFEPAAASDIPESSHTAVLGCSCGDVGCWPLVCQIQRTDAGVIWTDFQQPHRKDRDYSGFGPFNFDPDEYRSLIAELERTLLIALAEYQS